MTLWLSLTERCVHALVLLLEDAPHVWSRLREPHDGSGNRNRSSTWSALGRDCFETLLFWLEWTTMMTMENRNEATTRTTTTTTRTFEQGNRDKEEEDNDPATLIASLAMWTARAFHSMLEDHVDLVQSLWLPPPIGTVPSEPTTTTVTTTTTESLAGQRLLHLLQHVISVRAGTQTVHHTMTVGSTTESWCW